MDNDNRERIWTAALIVIGDEILSGRTQDRNVAALAQWLNRQGIRLGEVRIVSDDRAAIGHALKGLEPNHDYVFTTGGIGPTHDDITVDAIAAALGVPVVIHPEARAVLERWYHDRGGVNEARLRMARVPQGADLVFNRVSGAPGIRVGKIVILAGVPAIAAAMLEALEGRLQGGRPLLSLTVGAWALESEVAATLLQVEQRHAGLQIGSYPFFRDGRHGAHFVLRSMDADQLSRASADLLLALKDLGIQAREGEI